MQSSALALRQEQAPPTVYGLRPGVSTKLSLWVRVRHPANTLGHRQGSHWGIMPVAIPAAPQRWVCLAILLPVGGVLRAAGVFHRFQFQQQAKGICLLWQLLLN